MAGMLDGRVALISGTGGGQGREAALRFAAEGAVVVGCDVKEEGNRETLALVEAAGGKMDGTAPVDLGDPEQSRAWIEGAAAAHGAIDILYNNASAAAFATIEDMSIDEWRFGLRNEVDLVFYATKYAWPFLRRKGGVIVNIASIAALRGFPGSMQISHATTKGAIIAMTKHVATEGGPFGIRAVSISPGPIETPGTAELFSDPAVREGMISTLLVKRLGMPSDVVELALYLASDKASFITGANFVVDGGATTL